VYAAAMQSLLPDECRALGTLIEKAMTTPGQYPLTLNSLVTGINQKSNREPVVVIDEDRALRAIDSLRAKGLVRDVTFTGSRVEKYRHTAGEALGLRAPELAILTELLLRGPQTVGELRGRASRMHPLDSLESVEELLATMAKPREATATLAGNSLAENPLVREIAPFPGSRAPRWMQLLSPNLHAITVASGDGSSRLAPLHPAASTLVASDPAADTRLAELESRVNALEATVAELKSLLA
jgi:uncharacterized protein YceH (UPF0502 family)